MRILVTGGAGYIGSVLLPLLIKRGHEIRLFDAFFFGEAHLANYKGKIEKVRGDVRTVTSGVLRDMEAVIHLAALSNDPMANFAPDLNYHINTEATLRLARLAKEAGVRRFIFASSCSIYYHGSDNDHVYKESDPVNPREYYSHSKYLAEQVILPLATEDFAVTIVRKGTVCGYSPRLRLDLAINTMVKTALTEGTIIVNDGTQYRPFIDVRDVASAYQLLLTAPIKKINQQVFNVADKNYAILALANEVRKVLHQRLKRDFVLVVRHKVKDRTYKVSTRKMSRGLGWKPKWKLRQSVESLLGPLNKRTFDFDNPLHYNIERMKQLFPRLK